MKFFHISDLHIGKQLHHYNLKEDQKSIFDQIVKQVKKEEPQAVLMTGDIYDSAVPSAEAVALFDDFLTTLCSLEKRPVVMIIAGNHDSGKRLSYANRLLDTSGVHIVGLPPMKPSEQMQRVTLADAYGEVDFYLLPFTKPSHLRFMAEGVQMSYQEAVAYLIEREAMDTTKRNVILSHQFYTAGSRKPEQSESEMHTVGGLDQIDICVLEKFEYAALGHIHRPQKMGRECVRYCGTPLQYSVSEATDQKSITMVTLVEKGTEPIIETIPLEPLHRVRTLRGNLLEILENAQQKVVEDYVSITLTDAIDPYYPRERLEEVYPHILELRIENERTRKVLDFSEKEMESFTPEEAFSNFFAEMHGREMTLAETEKMAEVILKCQEAGE